MWLKLRNVTKTLSSKNLPLRVKKKSYKTTVSPATKYELSFKVTE